MLQTCNKEKQYVLANAQHIFGSITQIAQNYVLQFSYESEIVNKILLFLKRGILWEMKKCILILISSSFITFYIFITYFIPNSTSELQRRRISANTLVYKPHHRETEQGDSFSKHWMEFTGQRFDHEKYERFCDFKWKASQSIPWFELSNRTEFTKGYTKWRLNPVGEFSSIVLVTEHTDGSIKHNGGDHWRVRIKGPSSLPVHKIDHNNGTYQFRFLPLIPGRYQAFVWLEYTLCGGLKEPPDSWFIQGKSSVFC